MHKSRTSAFTLVEMLVVIAIITILIALLIPALGSAIALSRASECAAHLDEIGVAIRHAASEDAIVRPDKIIEDLELYMDKNLKVFTCPGAPGEVIGPIHYGFNGRMQRLSADDADKIVAIDYSISIVDPYTGGVDSRFPDEVRPRHFKSCNVLFYDGHVTRLTPDVFDPVKCENVFTYWIPTLDEQRYLTSDCMWKGPPIPEPPEGYLATDGTDNSDSDTDATDTDTDGSGTDGTTGCTNTGALIVDNGESNYFSGGFSTNGSPSTPGYQTDIGWALAGTGSKVAAWSFTVTPGNFSVAASWTGHSNRASNASYVIKDGGVVIAGPFSIDQQSAPSPDFTEDGKNFQILSSTVNNTSGTLRVELSDDANGVIVADAVRIECVD